MAAGYIGPGSATAETYQQACLSRSFQMETVDEQTTDGAEGEAAAGAARGAHEGQAADRQAQGARQGPADDEERREERPVMSDKKFSVKESGERILIVQESDNHGFVPIAEAKTMQDAENITWALNSLAYDLENARTAMAKILKAVTDYI
jgi:hypothetical protein